MNIRKVSSSQFTWVPLEGLFCAEISRFTSPNQREQFFGPVADNGMGLSVVSDRTGDEIHFRIFHVEWSKEQELLAWHLRPCASDVQRNPKLRTVRVVIYND